MAATYTGSCKCGALQISMQDEPSFVALCHCTSCQKSTGSTYSTNALFPRSTFTVTGTPKIYEFAGGSGSPAFAHSCGACCATMWTASPTWPDVVVVKVGCLDGGAVGGLVPRVETFTGRRPGWVGSVEGAGQFEGELQVGLGE